MDPEVNSQSFGRRTSSANTNIRDTQATDEYISERRSSVIDTSSGRDYYRDDYKYSATQHDTDIKPTASFSTPSIPSQQTHQYHHNNTIDATERIQFLREMEQAREELAEFRRNMAGLVQQMDGIAVDLEKSKDRVSEIEQDLTATEEVNVNLQVLLERAVKTQKESDVFATQAIRNMYSDLASVVYENNQLQGRLQSIENNQNQQKGSVHDIVKRMFEYTQMLEQAQGTIHMLQEPRIIKLNQNSSSTTFSSNTLSRRNSLLSFYNTEDDDNDSISTSIITSTSTAGANTNSTIKRPTSSTSNYIQSPPLGPQLLSPPLKPQQGLRMLFDSHGGNSLGLSSLTRKK